MEKEMKKSYKAVLLGATGATGKYLFMELIKAKEFTKIVTLGRKKATLPDDVTNINLEDEEKSGRVSQEIIDFENLSIATVGQHFESADVFLSTFGTTRRIAGSAENFRRIDYGYNYELAKIARESNVRMFSLLSSQGANKDSYFLYLNSKGKLEHDCGQLNFPLYSIFRPGLLDRGSSKRFVEKIAGFFMERMEVQHVARAMCCNALNQLSCQPGSTPRSSLYYNEEINHMSETADVNKTHHNVK